MKTRWMYLLLCLGNLLCFYPSCAQSFKVGTVWHYNVPSGLYRSYTEKDTVVAGVSCVKIVSETRVDAVTPEITSLPTFYVQDKGDTVWAYNKLFDKFTPLYVFNVVDGDTLTLPVFLYHPCESLPSRLADSNFRFIVDSVRMIRWDTSLLKTVFGHGIRSKHGDTLYMDWGRAGKQSVYVQHVGSIYSALLPNCNSCVSILDGACRSVDTLRCYQDDVRNIKLVSGACDKGLPPLSLDPGRKPGQKIRIYPNPAANYITVTSPSMSGRKAGISIADVLGKEIISRDLELSGNTQIDISRLSPGTYIARIITEEGNSYFEKIQVLK